MKELDRSIDPIHNETKGHHNRSDPRTYPSMWDLLLNQVESELTCSARFNNYSFILILSRVKFSKVSPIYNTLPITINIKSTYKIDIIAIVGAPKNINPNPISRKQLQKTAI